MLRIALLLAAGAVVTRSEAQTALKSVQYLPVTAADRKLHADFSLPQAGTALPQADPVVSVTVFAGGARLSPEKVTFTPADKIPNYRCAILILADKNLGRRLWHPARDVLSQLTATAESSPFEVELAAISAGNLEVLAPMGTKRDAIVHAIQSLDFNGSSPELYLGIKHAIEVLSGIVADRKYIILVSSGISSDQVISAVDIIDAANEAKIHLCTIGLPAASDSEEAVQKLEPLADQTGGYTVRADGRDLKLPPDTATNILRFAVSGGLIEVNLAGMTSPLKLDFNVNTQFSRTYEFSHTVDNLVPPPAATVLVTPPTAPTAVPSLTPIPVARPISSPSLLNLTKTWIRSNRALFLGAGFVILVVLIGLLALLFRKRKKSPVLQDPTVFVNEDAAVPTPIFAWLETLDAEQTRYPITKSAIRIGRKDDNDIVMKNDSVSGHHAEIVRRGSQFIIADLESSNSVIVGGKPIVKAALQNGDIVELGEVRLRFIEQPVAG